MRRLAATLVVIVGLTSGCVDVQQAITLERDLSGTARVAIAVNLEPMALFMAKLERGFSGKPGEPGEAEIAKARAAMLSDSRDKVPTDFEAEKRAMAESLPAGVRLLDGRFSEDGLKFAADITLAFDKVGLLAALAMPSRQTTPGAPAKAAKGAKGKSTAGSNPFDAPFEGLKVVDAGSTITVSMPVQNPVADEPFPGGGKDGPPDAETMKEIEALMGGLRFGFTLTTPFEVVEHTAHRREGTTLVWDYDLKKILKLTPKDMKDGIRVRYRK
jgi:hypothetical protein